MRLASQMHVETEFFHIGSRRLREPVQIILLNFPFNFHPLAHPPEYFLKRRFFDEAPRGVSFRFAPANPEPRRALRIYTHLLTHTHPHAHLTAIPAFPDAGGLETTRTNAKHHAEDTGVNRHPETEI